METVDLLALFWVAVATLFHLVAWGMFFSGLDDLFVDLLYWARRLTKRDRSETADPEAATEALLAAPERPIALMIPAWDESAVIGRMLRHTLDVYRYDRYHIFVGVYPNDPATREAVESVAAVEPRVHPVVTPAPGPTTKADCLNAVIDAIFDFERRSGVRFARFTYHDAEDIVHPYELKLANARVDAHMIQIPVVPLSRRWWHFTAGHYKDEFAEFGLKDLPVRRALGGFVPSAGVATSFSRHAIETLRRLHGGRVFSTRSLTEDYDIGYRLHAAGLRVDYVRETVRVAYRRPDGSVVHRDETIVSKGYFPATFRQAVRQKARWITGIVFQGTAKIGWPEGWGLRYILLRDRKGVVTHAINFLAYLLLFALSWHWLTRTLFPDWWHFPMELDEKSALHPVLSATLFFMLGRLAHRGYFTWRVYGPADALLSAPRMVWGNLINMFALFRAIGLYRRAKRARREVYWDKTAHEFPDTAQMERPL